MAAPFHYNATAKSLMMWATHELEHVGRIAAVEDPNIQYAYAMSTLNGMAHLKDALYEYVSANPDANWTKDLLTIHAQVIRVMQHLTKVYALNLNTIRAFNTRGTLSDLKYLERKNSRRTTRKRR